MNEEPQIEEEIMPLDPNAVTATFILISGNMRCGSCVLFEVTLPSGKLLDITGDRLFNKDDAFNSAFLKVNILLSKFDLILHLENVLELEQQTPTYDTESSRYSNLNNHGKQSPQKKWYHR